MITYPYDHYFSEDSVQTDIVITDGTASYSGTSLVVTGNTVLFTNENINSESMSLLETLCSDNVLHWGRCEASELKFTIHSTVVPLEGTILNVYLYFNNDASTLFKIGTYKVDSDIATAQRTVREITCYDSLLDVLNADYVDWYNALDFNTVNTVKKFRDAFFTHVGITQRTVSLVNDSVTITKVATEALSGSQILNAICEINGRFGHIDRNGQFAYIKLEQNIQGLYPAVDLYPSPTLYPQHPKSTPIASGSYIPPLKYEKYEVPSITRLQIRTDDSDIGVVVGTAGTDYVVQGNFLTFNLDATALTGIANNILGEISGVIFQPFEVQMRANLCFEVGDAIRCNDDLTGVEGYILYRNAVGIQAMIDTLNCLKERDYKLDANSVGYQFNAVNNRTASIRTDVDEVSATLTYQLDPTAGEPGGTHNSYAYQTAQEIGSKVETSTYNTFVNTTYSTFVSQTNDAIDQRVTKTEFNYQLDPTQAGGGGVQESYAHQTADQISQKVSTTTYNDFVNNTYATFVTQTDSSLTAKAEKTVGNFTTGFSCTLDTTGHTWYKDNQQVMKIDENGLTVSGTIQGSTFYCGTLGSETTYISADGMEAEFADGSARFAHDYNSYSSSIGYGAIFIDVDDYGSMDVTMNIGGGGGIGDCDLTFDNINHWEFDGTGGTVFEYDEDDGTNHSIFAIGSDIGGTIGVDEVALNGSDWLHIGYSTPAIHIGGIASTTDLELRAKSFSNIVFYQDNTSVPTKSLASILSDISTAYNTASSAYSVASGAASDVSLLFTAFNSLSGRVTSLETEARSHGWNV